MIQNLNARKKEILDQQEKMLQAASEAKVQLTAAQNETFETLTKELDATNTSIARIEAINKGKAEVGAPANQIVLPDMNSVSGKKYTNCTSEYASKFWNALSTTGAGAIRTGSFSTFSMTAALSEGGTAADGSYLVPSITDPTIPALAVIEAAARKLSRVIPTEMDVKLPYQASKSVAAAKAESTDAGTHAFGASAPTFNTTTLSAFMAGNQVPVSWELLQDVKALSAFLPAELNRAIFTYEEEKFVNGSGTGEPLGYLNGATAFATEALTIDNILDLTGALKQAYYSNASFLLNRQELIRLYKAQIAANQYQTYITYDPNGQCRLLGFPVNFSSAMPVYVASPATTGAVLFGNFGAGWVIGDRGDNNIRIKVLDQVAALNGQTIFLGYRRTDQRCTLQETVQLLTTNA